MCWFLDAGNDETLHTLNRPASKKRQGTKSREVGHRGCSECYEDLMPARTLMIDVALAEFGLRVCTYGNSGKCNRRLGERSERTDARCAH